MIQFNVVIVIFQTFKEQKKMEMTEKVEAPQLNYYGAIRFGIIAAIWGVLITGFFSPEKALGACLICLIAPTVLYDVVALIIWTKNVPVYWNRKMVKEMLSFLAGIIFTGVPAALLVAIGIFGVL